MATIIKSYKEHVAFNAAKFNPVPLGQSERVRALLVCLEPGQFIPVHHPGVDMTLLVLEGKAQVTAGENESAVEPGAVVFVKGGEARGIKAQTRFVALHVVSPPPNEADHKEVMAGLARGTWK